MFRFLIPLLLSCMAMQAQENPDHLRMSAEVDLLPVATGGWYGSLAAGKARWRMRAVASEVHVPAAFTPTGWKEEHLQAEALLVDHFFRSGFTGPWMGTGLEHWRESALREGTPDRIRLQSLHATLGGGWVFPLGRGFTINPWLALHQRIAGTRRAFAREQEFHPAPLQAEASIKIGYSW